jgi:hypothetical protein
VLRKLGRAQLLILDDLGLGAPTEAQRHDLLDVLEDRYGAAPPSSPASCQGKTGTNGSGTPPWPTPSWTDSSTTRTRSIFKAPHGERTSPELTTTRRLTSLRSGALRACPHAGGSAVHIRRNAHVVLACGAVFRNIGSRTARGRRRPRRGHCERLVASNARSTSRLAGERQVLTATFRWAWEPDSLVVTASEFSAAAGETRRGSSRSSA